MEFIICQSGSSRKKVIKSMNGEYSNWEEHNKRIEQMRKEWFITRELGSGTKNVSENIEQALKLDTTSLHVAAQFESSEMVRRAVEAGAGIAFISKTAAKESLDKQKVLEFSFGGVNTKRKMYLMYHKERRLGEAAEQMIGTLKDYCVEKYSII